MGNLSPSIPARTVRLGGGLTVEFDYRPGGLNVEWSPDVPRRLTRKQIAKYRAARDAYLEQLALARGESWAVADGFGVRILGLASAAPGGRA